MQKIYIIYGPQQGRSYTTTRPLSITSHPTVAEQWPKWAEVAIVHTVEASEDLYVTFASDANAVAAPHQRMSLCGLSITVNKLFVWDWGPVELDKSTVIRAERCQVMDPCSPPEVA